MLSIVRLTSCQMTHSPFVWCVWVLICLLTLPQALSWGAKCPLPESFSSMSYCLCCFLSNISVNIEGQFLVDNMEDISKHKCFHLGKNRHNVLDWDSIVSIYLLTWQFVQIFLNQNILGSGNLSQCWLPDLLQKIFSGFIKKQ